MVRVVVAEPPSAFVTVTVKAPGVAAPEFAGFVGVTLNTIEVAVEDVMEDVNEVPSTPLANETAGDAKPVPVMVTVVAAEASQTVFGLIAEIVGAASITTALASEAVVPLASVSVAEQVLAVPVVAA
jgi:hypothetical protein